MNVKAVGLLLNGKRVINDDPRQLLGHFLTYYFEVWAAGHSWLRVSLGAGCSGLLKGIASLGEDSVTSSSTVRLILLLDAKRQEDTIGLCRTFATQTEVISNALATQWYKKEVNAACNRFHNIGKL